MQYRHNSKNVTCFAHCHTKKIQVLSSPCFYFTGFACLFFFFQVYAILFLQVLDNKVVFFYTPCNSSSLLFTSRKSLSERVKSIKQLSTTMTKLYSNNTSLVVNSPVPLVSVLEVFMLEWVMSSIAAAQRNQSTVVLFFDPVDVSPSLIVVCCDFIIVPGRETGFQVTALPEIVIYSKFS